MLANMILEKWDGIKKSDRLIASKKENNASRITIRREKKKFNESIKFQLYRKRALNQR